MSLITPDELRAATPEMGEEWTDDALQGIIDREEAEIVRLFGSHTRARETAFPRASSLLYPSRKVAAIVSISETSYDVTTVLDPTDYSVIDGGHTIRRLRTGVNVRSLWGSPVEVEYVPADEVQVRVGVLIELAQVGLQPAGVQSRTMGSWREDYATGQGSSRAEQRTAILRRLAPATVIA